MNNRGPSVELSNGQDCRQSKKKTETNIEVSTLQNIRHNWMDFDFFLQPSKNAENVLKTLTRYISMLDMHLPQAKDGK